MTPIERQLYDALSELVRIMNEINAGQQPLPTEVNRVLVAAYDALNAADDGDTEAVGRNDSEDTAARSGRT